MSAPDLTITFEPVEGSALVYATLAAKSSVDQSNGQLLLVLNIKNEELFAIEVTEVKISFPGRTDIGPFAIDPHTPPPLTTPPTPPIPLTIAPGATKEWTLLESWNPNIILTFPAPATITVSLSCIGLDSPATVFNAPAEVSMPLAQYSSPAAGGGYAFPFKVDDLNPGEILTGLSNADYHRARSYDISVYKYRSLTKDWHAFPEGADITKNESYYVWEKPVYAVAGGEVVLVYNGTADNPIARVYDDKVGPPNHVNIRHGTEIVSYNHFKLDTIDSAIKVNKTVAKGQFLGLVGNSGRSTEPHLHIGVSRAVGTSPNEGPLRPFPFSDIYVLDLPAVDGSVWAPNMDTPWNRVTAQCLPSTRVAIWPSYLRISKKKFFSKLTSVSMIILGALLIGPGGGGECIACGPVIAPVLGVVSVVLGVVGLVLGGRKL